MVHHPQCHPSILLPFLCTGTSSSRGCRPYGWSDVRALPLSCKFPLYIFHSLSLYLSLLFLSPVSTTPSLLALPPHYFFFLIIFFSCLINFLYSYSYLGGPTQYSPGSGAPQRPINANFLIFTENTRKIFQTFRKMHNFSFKISKKIAYNLQFFIDFSETFLIHLRLGSTHSTPYSATPYKPDSG